MSTVTYWYNHYKMKLKKGIYKHFKGHFIEVLFIARHTENEEEMVVYREIGINKKYGKDSLWVRPLKMFFETVQKNGKKVKRFEFVK